MALTKKDRAQVKAMYGGRCAYCGEPLADRWHVDHVEPVRREFRFKSGGGIKNTGRLLNADNDRLENMKPACAPCNIDKHSMPLEAWREKLQRTCDVLERNSPTYRHGLRFGLIEQRRKPVQFYFERNANE